MSVAVCRLLTSCDPPITPTTASGDQAGSQLRQSAGAENAQDMAKPQVVKIPASGDVLMIGGWSAGNKSTATAEFYDPNTKKFKLTGSMAVSEAAGVAALITSGPSNGQVLAAGGFSGSSKFTKKTVSNTITGSATSNLQLFDPLTGSFGTPGALTTPRLGATATTLPSGSILIAGGADSTGTPTATAEIFDASTATLVATANNMSTARMFHTATLLGNGTVLLVGGGIDLVGSVTGTADIFDPSTNTFTPALHSLNTGRAGQAAVLLTTGPLATQVLVIGGVTQGGFGLNPVSAIENYDPVAQTFSNTASTNDPRAFPTATELLSGDVLIVGGFCNFASSVNGGSLMSLFGSSLSSAELFDTTALTSTCVGTSAVSGGFICGAAMKMARGAHTATLFSSGPLTGEVLIAGGLGAKKPNSKSKELSETELYDPTTSSFAKTGGMKKPRGLQAAVLLP